MTGNKKIGQMSYPGDWELLDSSGFLWFTTRTVHRLPDGSVYVWDSRGHRKGLGAEVIAPGRLTWWIAVLFMIGSFHFALGSFISLFPHLFSRVGENPLAIDAIFFTGSIFFTTASYLQLLESINAGDDIAVGVGIMRKRRFRWFAWMPRRIDYLACLIQFAGTLMFNLSTFSAMVVWLSFQQQERYIWRPDFFGSICFLISGILVLFEVCHRLICWRARSISWWVMAINLAGCAGFMISAIFAFITPKTAEPLDQMAVNVFTFQGAVCFFIGACLLLPEMFSYRQTDGAEPGTPTTESASQRESPANRRN